MSPELTAVPTGLAAEVTRVVDGDTMDVEFVDGTTDRVRLLGVDTPETNGSNKPYEYGDIIDTVCLDRWGAKASEFARLVLGGRQVNVVLDPAAGERDRFGRLLAYIETQGNDFNAALVKLGYARVYEEGESSREEAYLRLQAQAKETGMGLWRCADGFVPPELPLVPAPEPAPGVVSTSQVVIECIYYDGAVIRTEADEYV